MSSPAHWSQPSLSSPVTDGSFTHAHTPASPARVEARKFSQRQKEQSPGIAKCICLPPADLSKSTSVTTGPAVSRAPSWAHPRWRRPCCGGICLRYTGGSYSTGLLTRMCDARLCVQSHTLALALGHTCPTGSSYSSGHKDGRKSCSK